MADESKPTATTPLSRNYKLFENAIDSLEVGIKFFFDDSLATSHKHAILNIFHSIELLLKEKLRRIHTVLIFRDIDRAPITAKTQTVGLKEMFVLYKNLEIILDKEDLALIEKIRGRRNEIVHFEFIPGDNDEDWLAVSFSFIKKFLRDHLGVVLADCISEEAYGHIEEIVDSFEERYDRAVSAARELVQPKTKDDLSEQHEVIDCPLCWTLTLACTGGDEGHCTLCKHNYDVKICYNCGGYTTALADDMGMCDGCVERLSEKINAE